ncbi:hypothetical protein C1H76_3613 [Elsinoe australis]|uniref:Uncharacterized protein n=1 Tax=Elsinoe australis TaxID=40998 RepID=A0A4U7B2Y5_9PEZI|nr:hypothetical protein C1H76_3613 [Elsinoe australis]
MDSSDDVEMNLPADDDAVEGADSTPHSPSQAPHTSLQQSEAPIWLRHQPPPPIYPEKLQPTPYSAPIPFTKPGPSPLNPSPSETSHPPPSKTLTPKKRKTPPTASSRPSKRPKTPKPAQLLALLPPKARPPNGPKSQPKEPVPGDTISAEIPSARQLRETIPLTQSEVMMEKKFVLRDDDVDRVRHYNEVEPSYFRQYLPADQKEKERWMRRLYPGLEAGGEGERGKGIFEFLEEHLGKEESGEKRAGSEGGGSAVGSGRAAAPAGLVSEAAFALAGLSQTKEVVKRPDAVLVRCSLFVGVMLNIQARYGVEVHSTIQRLLPKEASVEELKELGMSDGQATVDKMDQMAISGLLTGDGKGMEEKDWNRVMIGNVLAGKPMPGAQGEVQQMVREWETRYPGLLGWRGSQMLRVDTKRMQVFEQELMKEMGMTPDKARVDAVPTVFMAELEAEAERRAKKTVVFRSLDGKREVLNAGQ